MHAISIIKVQENETTKLFFPRFFLMNDKKSQSNAKIATRCCCSNTADDATDHHQQDEDSENGQSSCPLPSKVKPHVPNSKKVYIVLAWITLTHCLYNYTVFNVGGLLDIGQSAETFPLYVIGAAQAVTLLLYPIGGIIGEVYCTRFNTLRASTVIMLLSILIAPILLVMLMFLTPEQSRQLGGIFIAVFLTPFQIGLALFESNVIQFGTDQLLFASSDVLSNFVHWSFWCTYLVPALTTLLICPVHAAFSSPPRIELSSLLVGPLVEGIGLLIALIVVFLPCTKRHLQIAKRSKKNPISLIYGVMKYTLNNKQPAARSAFTHNDEESHIRINFAKKRYGGPFTTEEVEDVKTFWRISILLVSLFGFLLLDNTGNFVVQYTNLQITKVDSGIGAVTQCIIKNYGVTFYVVLIGVPVHKLIISPFFYRYAPNMIKRMGIGLILTCFSLATELALSIVLNDAFHELGFVDVCGDNTSFVPGNITIPDTLISHYVLIVPQVLNGFSLLLIFLTTIEFILAQAPRSMQGLLIGFWYSIQSINVLNSSILSSSSAGCEYISYSIRLGIAVASVIAFVIVSLWYKGRMRQEISLIKLKTIIENYTVRNLRRHPTATDVYGDASYDNPYDSGEYNLSMFSIYSIFEPQ